MKDNVNSTNMAETANNEKEDKKASRMSNNKKKPGSKSGKRKRGFKTHNEKGDLNRIGNKGYDNDINWYTQTLTLLKPVTKVSMIPIHGTDFVFETTKPYVKRTDKIGMNVPGIAVTHYDPIIPMTAKSPENDFGDDVFTTAGKTLFAQLRKTLNGVRPYNTPDLLSYILLVGSISAYMEHVRRLYNMTFYTNPLSRYHREFLVDQVGYPGDYEYLIKSGPTFISRFNAIALKLRNLLLPIGLPIVSRWKWLNTYMFADANVLKPQLIITKPDGFYKLNYGGKKDAAHPYTVDYLDLNYERLETCINQLEMAVDDILQNDIISIINADLLRAFGNSNVIHTPMILDNLEFTFNPVYSEEFLAQWEHYTPINKRAERYHVILNNKTNEFEMQLQLKDLAKLKTTRLNGTAVITTDNPELTPEEVIIKTRMMTLYWKDQADKEHYSFGSEIWHETKIVQYGRKSSYLYENVIDITGQELGELTNELSDEKIISDTIMDHFSNFIRTYSKLSVFSHHPIVYLVDENADHSSTGTVLGRVNNYGVIDYNTLRHIQTAILTSLVGLSDRTGIQAVLEAKNKK